MLRRATRLRLKCLYRHTWGRWEMDGLGVCTRSRVCTICGHQEIEEEVHTWGAWSYDAPKSCQLIRFCRVCQQREDRAPFENEHEWVQYHYPGICNSFMLACQRCGVRQDIHYDYPQHRWSDWALGGGKAQRICGHCGELEEQLLLNGA